MPAVSYNKDMKYEIKVKYLLSGTKDWQFKTLTVKDTDNFCKIIDQINELFTGVLHFLSGRKLENDNLSLCATKSGCTGCIEDETYKHGYRFNYDDGTTDAGEYRKKGMVIYHYADKIKNPEKSSPTS